MLWVRSAFFALVLPGTVVGWVPRWLTSGRGTRWDLGAARWVGVPLLALGAAGLLWCIWDFGRVGRGTLAPVDPPRYVVRAGLYRVIRNPMYISVLTVLVGEALITRAPVLFLWAAIMATGFHVFVVAYEEPSLRRRFGAEYEAYCAAVGRWVPHRAVGLSDGAQ